MPLGHSGLLITWEPQTENPFHYFTFNINFARKENDGNSESDNRESPIFLGRQNKCSVPGNDSLNHCYSSAYGKSHTIHSLNESTLYEIIIRQYTENWSLVKT